MDPEELLRLLLSQQVPQPSPQAQGLNLAQAIPLALARAGEIQAESSGLVNRGGFAGQGTSRILAELLGQGGKGNRFREQLLASQAQAELLGQQLRATLGLGESKSRESLNLLRQREALSELQRAPIKTRKAQIDLQQSQSDLEKSNLELQARQAIAEGIGQGSKRDQQNALNVALGGKLSVDPAVDPMVQLLDTNPLILDVRTKKNLIDIESAKVDPDVNEIVKQLVAIDSSNDSDLKKTSDKSLLEVISSEALEVGGFNKLFERTELGPAIKNKDTQRRVLNKVGSQFNNQVIQLLKQSGEFGEVLRDLRRLLPDINGREILERMSPGARRRRKVAEKKHEAEVKKSRELREFKNSFRFRGSVEFNQKAQKGNDLIVIYLPLEPGQRRRKVRVIDLKDLNTPEIKALFAKGAIAPGIR